MLMRNKRALGISHQPLTFRPAIVRLYRRPRRKPRKKLNAFCGHARHFRCKRFTTPANSFHAPGPRHLTNNATSNVPPYFAIIYFDTYC
jgi:hypothetical protein